MASPKSHTQTELDRITAKDSFLKNAELMAMTLSQKRRDELSVHFQRGIDMQRLSRGSTRRIMRRIGFFAASTETVVLSAG